MTKESYPAEVARCGSAYSVADSRTSVVEAQRRRDRAATAGAPFEPTEPWKESAISAIFRAEPSTTTEGQNARVLKILREVGETTAMELQRFADVRHAPARILQLKKAGHTIIDRWVRQVTDLGHSHRTKAYRLVEGRPSASQQPNRCTA